MKSSDFFKKYDVRLFDKFSSKEHKIVSLDLWMYFCDAKDTLKRECLTHQLNCNLIESKYSGYCEVRANLKIKNIEPIEILSIKLNAWFFREEGLQTEQIFSKDMLPNYIPREEVKRGIDIEIVLGTFKDYFSNTNSINMNYLKSINMNNWVRLKHG